jgi:hypothetical protein
VVEGTPQTETRADAGFRYSGWFPLEHLRPDEQVLAADHGGTPGSCCVERPGCGDVDDAFLAVGDWFARHDDDQQTPLVVPKDVVAAILKSCERERV